MSKKLLSLIHDGDIQLAPGTKILPADTFSTLLSAEEVLETVQKDAKQYREEVIRELEAEKEAARKEGFAVGMEAWVDQIRLLEKEVDAVHSELSRLVAPLAIKAAKKIVGRELEMNKDVLVDIVANSLKAVSQHQVISIYIHPSDREALEANKERLRSLFDRLESLTIQARDDIEPGGCVVETEAGIINVELEHQWQRLEQAIGALVAKPDGEPASSPDESPDQPEESIEGQPDE